MKYNDNKEYWVNRYNDMSGENVVGCNSWNMVQYDKVLKKFVSLLLDNLTDEMIEKITKGTICDLGCGIARFFPLLFSFQPVSYVGFDIVSDTIDIANRQYENIFNADFRLIEMDSSLNFKEHEKISLLWTNVVLQHIIDDDLVSHYLEQCYDKMIDGGVVILTENISVNKSNNYIHFRDTAYYNDKLKLAGFKNIRTAFVYDMDMKEDHVTIFAEK